MVNVWWRLDDWVSDDIVGGVYAVLSKENKQGSATYQMGRWGGMKNELIR